MNSKMPTLILLTLMLLCTSAAEAQKPNILFILINDFGWQDVGYNGSTFYETPQIDKLSLEWMRFNNGYTPSRMCSPTRASILTGMNPARHGIAFPGAKTTVYEPGVKLPCIVKNPCSKYSGVNNAMISWGDLTPTILELADVPFSSKEFHGRSIVSILGETNPEGWDTVYASHNFHEIMTYYPMQVIRDHNYKLNWNIACRSEYPFASDLWAASSWQGVYRSGGKRFGKRKVQDYLFRAEFELYDLSDDSDEIHSLAEIKEHTATLKSLKAKMKAFQVKTKDPWLIV